MSRLQSFITSTTRLGDSSTKTPTVSSPSGRPSTILRTGAGAIFRDDSANTNPTASAPAEPATRASSSHVTPSIFTNTTAPSDRGDLFGEVARHRVALPPVHERRLLDRADLLRLPAPGPEPTSRRRVGGAGDVALEHDPLPLPLLARVRHRHRREQRLRVRVARPLVHVVAVADLHDLAEVHHRD